MLSGFLHKIKWNLPVNHLVENINKEGYLVIEKWYNFPIFQQQTLFSSWKYSFQAITPWPAFVLRVWWPSISSNLLFSPSYQAGLDSSFTPTFYRLVIIGHNVICFTWNGKTSLEKPSEAVLAFFYSLNQSVYISLVDSILYMVFILDGIKILSKIYFFSNRNLHLLWNYLPTTPFYDCVQLLSV